MKVNKRPVYRIIKTAEETFKLDSLKVLLENINFNLLAEEIEICKPDVLIFLTDKNKDSLLNKKFRG